MKKCTSLVQIIIFCPEAAGEKNIWSTFYNFFLTSKVINFGHFMFLANYFISHLSDSQAFYSCDSNYNKDFLILRKKE